MRAGIGAGRWVAALIAFLVMLLVGPAASALGAAQVRFVHAVPGAGAVQLDAAEGGRTQPVADGVGFGQVADYADVPAGMVTFELLGPNGRSLAVTEEEVKDGAHYTVVGIGNGETTLALIRDGGAKAGESRLRVVQAASELGEVDVRLGNRRVAEVFGFEDVAPYTGVDPGTYELRITRPGDGSELAAQSGVTLAAGTSSTAFVIGTGGEPVQVVVTADQVAAPTGAPATGLGGLADDESRLLLALLAGLLAAAIGAGGYLVLTGRSRGHGS